jgi:phosphate transport system substrate-binding protein
MLAIMLIGPVLAVGLLAGCGGSNQTDDGDGFLDTVVDMSAVTSGNYPRVDGSTSTHPLQVIIACDLLGTNYYWEEWPDGTTRAVPTSGDPDKQDEVQFIMNGVVHNGTHGSYVNLIENNADIILAARRPSEDELDLADEKGVDLNVFAVALDAFVFIVNVENPVTSLTVSQVQGIYTGDITNWQEVGGNDAVINAYQRDVNSGSQQLMLTLVMDGLEMIDAPDMILMGMMGPINRISTDELGIGYTVYFFKQFMAPSERLKMIGIDGVQPDSGTIGNRSYRYTTEVFAATRKDQDKTSTAWRLRQWLRTLAGQEVIRDSGYVPALVK